MQLTEQLYAYPWQGAGNNCNTYLINGPMLALVDPGHMRNDYRQSCIDPLRQAMQRDGFELEQVELVLITHGHPDHCGAAMHVKELSGCQVALHQDELDHIALMQRMLPSQEPDTAPQPDFYLQPGTLELGQPPTMPVEVIHTPGHSPGSVSFYLPSCKALIPGDVIFAGSLGRTDFPGGDSHQLQQSITALAQLDVEVLLPGHMQMLQGQQSVARNFQRVLQMYFR